jgi:PAS domain S-box-containing protein
MLYAAAFGAKAIRPGRTVSASGECQLNDVREAALNFLDGGGNCAELISAIDWSGTLGPIGGWPQSLKTATSLLLRSPVPMAMLWGEDGIMLYNDPYSVFAGGRHPQLLGSKVREGWPEVADFNDNVMRVGLAGGTLQYRDQELTLYRNGGPEQVWMNLDYSPVVDESGKPAGVLAIVVETSERVAIERALRERESRLRFFDELGMATRALIDPFEIMGVTARMLGQHLNASVCAYADMDEDEDGFTIRGDWAAPGSQSIVGKYKLADFGETADRELHAGRPLITRDTLAELGPDEGAGLLGLGLKATVCMPFVKAGRLTALMAVHQAEPRDWKKTELALIAEATERSWAYIERTRTEVALRLASERAQAESAEREAILSQLGEGVIVTDQEGRITFVNEAAERLHGVKLLGVEPENYTDSYHLLTEAGEPHPPLELPLARAVLRGETIVDANWRIRRSDGTEVLASGNAKPVLDGSGKRVGGVLTVRDETERHSAELALAESEERLRLATEAAEIGFWDLDTAADQLFWPARVKAMFGISADRPVSMNDFYEALHPADRDHVTEQFKRASDPEIRGLYDVEYRTIGKEDGVLRWVAAKGRGIFDDSGRCVRVVGTAIDITARKRAEEHQRLLIDELSHRAKNLLAIVQAVAHQTLRSDASPDEMRKAFEGRLGALGAAHSILTQQMWESAPIRSIIRDTVLAVCPNDRRILAQGPNLLLPPKTSVSLAMAIHELATNALKYGALSNEKGRVDIRWSSEGERLKLIWQERDGPIVAAPSRRGFGSRMIERGLAAELGGSVAIRFDPAGVICTVDAPLPEAHR